MTMTWRPRTNMRKLDRVAQLLLWLVLSSLLAVGFQATHSVNDVPVDAPGICDQDISPLSVAETDMQPDPVQSESLRDLGTMRITVYGPPLFPESSHVSRWFGRTRDEKPFTVASAMEWASDLGLDGVCAASPGPSGLYRRHREFPPVIIQVENHGRYLLVDRTDTSVWNTIDIWVLDPWPGGTYFCEHQQVSEVLP